MEASHDGNKNNLIPVDKLFSARPNTPIAVALPDRNDTGDNTGNVDKADNAADASAQEQTQSAEQSQMAEQPTSETAEQQPAEQQSKPMHATQPQTEQPGTVTAEDDDERFRPQKQPIAARAGRNRRIQADLRTGIGIRPCVQRRPRQAGADHRGRRPDLR